MRASASRRRTALAAAVLPYTRKTDKGCVASLPSNVALKTIPWGQDLMRFDELHRFVTGMGRTVAVIDTGVNAHDFQGRLSGGGDYVAKGGTGLEDCDGHGTQVAGVIAANPKDDSITIGFKGIAYDAKIVSIRQSSDYYEYKPPEGSGQQALDRAGSLRTLAKAVVNAANRGDIDVINMSVDTCRSADSPISDMELEPQRAPRYAVEVKDIVLVASAGNTDTCPEQNNADPDHPKYIVSPPWFSDYVLSVAAIGSDGAAAPFSVHGPWVGVAAPGTEIISLDPADRTRLVNVTADKDGKPSPIQGTSFASPYVAGLAALTAQIPAEEGVAADQAKDVPFRMPPAPQRDWVPLRVAILGSGGGIAVLLLTLFIVHTVRRNRTDRHESA